MSSSQHTAAQHTAAQPGAFQPGREFAQRLDAADPLAPFRQRFRIPRKADGTEQVYLVGNSLGLPTIDTAAYVETEIERWATLGVAGHFTGELAWKPYHELLTDQMAAIVGGRPEEVVVMNSLTVNLHLLMISFYRPTPERHKVLIEAHAFPSDHFAVESQIRQRGYDPAESLIVVPPADESDLLDLDALVAAIDDAGDELAMVMLPGVQYYTGQVLPMARLTEAAHRVGATIGFDLAHAAGNIELALHDWDVDFAAWCTYKYLNSGPGGVGGAFVHRRHVNDQGLPKLLGWWGTDKATRFEMDTTFEPIPTVESWQLSNAPILSMAALRASLDVFTEAGGMAGGMKALRAKSEQQIAYLDYLLGHRLDGLVRSLTPVDLAERGCQFALEVTAPDRDGKTVHAALEEAGVACDWRHPNVIRVAAVPLYNSFTDICDFVDILEGLLR